MPSNEAPSLVSSCPCSSTSPHSPRLSDSLSKSCIIGDAGVRVCSFDVSNYANIKNILILRCDRKLALSCRSSCVLLLAPASVQISEPWKTQCSFSDSGMTSSRDSWNPSTTVGRLKKLFIFMMANALCYTFCLCTVEPRVLERVKRKRRLSSGEDGGSATTSRLSVFVQSALRQTPVEEAARGLWGSRSRGSGSSSRKKQKLGTDTVFMFLGD